MKFIDCAGINGDFLPNLINHLEMKARRSSRRRDKVFSSKRRKDGSKHWYNHAGTFADSDRRKGPKYWHGQAPVILKPGIVDRFELKSAMEMVERGHRNCDNYHNIDGDTRQILRAIQSERDRRSYRMDCCKG